MNVFQIIAEDEELEEVIPFTKKAKMMKQAGKAAKGATKDEARQLEVELLTYLKTSGQTATADAVLKYFDQKGYGNVAAPIIANLKTKGNKKADRQTAKADKRQAKADAKAAAQADAEKAAGLEKQRQGMAAMSSMYSEAEGQDVLTKREVRGIIKQVVQKGYGGAAGFGKGKFAAPDPKFKSANAKPDPAIQKAADMLKKAGYTVTKT
jgi:hypothetical protein